MQAVMNPPVQQFPKRRNADHAGDVAVLDRFRQIFTRQFIEVSDLSAATQRRKKTGREFKSMMQRQNRQHSIAGIHVKDRRKHRDHAGEIAMRQHDAFWSAGSARGEDERSHGLRGYAFWQKRDALVLGLFIRQFKHFIECPNLDAFQSCGCQTSW